MRALVLTNPRAGRGASREAGQRAVDHLRRAGVEARQVVTERAGHAADLAAAARGDFDLFVSVGGDGTLREVVVGLGEGARAVDLAVVPIGNANVVARELEVPLDPAGAIELLTSGRPRPIDVGEVDDGRTRRLFLAMVGVGFDAIVIHGVEVVRGTGPGAWAYAHGLSDVIYSTCALPALVRLRPCRFTLEEDGAPLALGAPTVLVCNIATYAKGWSMAPGARIDSGRLHWMATRDARPHRILLHLVAAARRREAPRLARYGEGRRLRLSAPRPFHWQVDGDVQPPVRALDVGVLPSFARMIGRR